MAGLAPGGDRVTCIHCKDLQIAVETLARAVEQLAAGNPGAAAQAAESAKYWLR